MVFACGRWYAQFNGWCVFDRYFCLISQAKDRKNGSHEWKCERRTDTLTYSTIRRCTIVYTVFLLIMVVQRCFLLSYKIYLYFCCCSLFFSLKFIFTQLYCALLSFRADSIHIHTTHSSLGWCCFSKHQVSFVSWCFFTYINHHSTLYLVIMIFKWRWNTRK